MLDLVLKLKAFNKQQAVPDEAGINSRVLLVDSMNTYIRCFAAIPSMNDDGEHIGGITGYLKSVGQAIRQLHSTRVICVFDGAGGSQRRRRLFEGYKNNRRPMEHLNRAYNFKDTDEEKKAMKWQLHLLVDILDYLPVNVFSIDNIEADDAIAYLAELVQKRGGQVTIFSTDKDFLQMVTENCNVYNPVKKKIYDINAVIEEYGVHPNNFLLYRMVEGDKSDNIPGVKGIGPATMLKLFPALRESKQLTIDDLLDVCQRNEDITESSGCKKLLVAKDTGQIELNYQLMELKDVNISGTAKLELLTGFDSSPHELNKYVLTRKFGEFRLFSAFGNYDEWLVTTWTPLLRFLKD